MWTRQGNVDQDMHFKMTGCGAITTYKILLIMADLFLKNS